MPATDPEVRMAWRSNVRVRKAISFACSVLNCLMCGDVAVLALYGPVFQAELGCTQLQFNMIGIACQMGQYIPVPITGSICDRYGPNVLCLAAGFVFPLIYLMACELYLTRAAWWLFVPVFFVIGMVNCFLYLPAVSTSAKNHEKHRGVAVAVPVSAFGLSALWQSQVAGHFFQRLRPLPADNGVLEWVKEIDIPRFWTFYAVILGASGFISYAGLCVLPDQSEIVASADPESPGAAVAAADETEPLLPPHHQPHLKGASIPQFLADYTAWLFFIGFLFTGLGEMYMNSLGTIYQSLLDGIPARDRSVARSFQVSLLSFVSMVSRLVFGSLSDVLSSGTLGPRIPRIALLVFLHILAVVASLLFASGAVGRDGHAFSYPTALIGASYGGTFTVFPAVISAVWGVENFATFWGILTYAPAFGGLFYGVVYGSEYDSKAGADGLCVGLTCFHTTFVVCIISGLCAVGIWACAWRAWSKRGIVA